jgi:hypothetical protein
MLAGLKLNGKFFFVLGVCMMISHECESKTTLHFIFVPSLSRFRLLSLSLSHIAPLKSDEQQQRAEREKRKKFSLPQKLIT